ncbi:MAG: peptidoglycan-binding domain-containing protein [Caldimonas sp.]
MAKPLSREQRAWLEELGGIVGGAPVELEEEQDEVPAGASRSGRVRSLVGDPGPADKEGLVGFGPADIPGAVVEKVLGKLTATCMINNNTQQTLRVDSASLSEIDDDSGKTMGIAHGEFQEFPPSQIKADDQGSRFVAANKETDLLIVKVRTAGIEGFVRYFIDDKKTAWVLHFNNPRVGSNSADARLEGPNAANFETPKVAQGGGNDAKFLYVLNPKGGAVPPNPNPNPNPGPNPATDFASSCLIQVLNKTQQKLTLKTAKHERGDFMVRPKPSLEAGEFDDAIVSIETPRAEDDGCKGFLEYAIGEPQTGVWRVDWDNPEGKKNTADATISPASATMDSLAVISQGDENVRVNFTLRETGGAAPVTPTPVTPIPAPPIPTPVTPTSTPPKTRQPTLRVGDKSPDGWVEYLQERLNDLDGAGLKVDGDFGKGTLAAVLKFQQSRNLQADGTVGNQTWAALRDATPEAPSTDGRKPHTFVQKGPQARWNDEKERAIYQTSFDEMLLFLVSVGTEPIDSFSVDVTVTAPGMPASTQSFPIGAPDKTPATGSGSFHSLKMRDFRKRFPSKKPGAKITDYVIVAVLPQALSGEGWTGSIVEAS